MKTFPQAIRGAFALASILVALCGCKPPDGVGTTDRGTVTGRVVDTQSTLPIAGATITVGNAVVVTAPIDKGGFVLRNVPVGTQTLTIDAIGWQRYRTTITVQKGTPLDIGVIGLPSSLTTQ